MILGALDGSRIQSKVEAPPGDSGDGRQTLPVEVILQHRCLSSGRPRAIPIRPLAQPAFVHEHYGSTLVSGFFLISGQRFFFHCRIASSSRSKARPVGRWQLHPNCRNIRQTWPGWYVTPQASPIKWATRLAVHSLVSYPSASGPRFKPPSIFFRSAGLSRGLRPARPACLSPALPLSANCHAHRFTDWRCTPTRRATSASDSPRFNSLPASIRRRSNASKSRRTPSGFPMPTTIHSFLSDVTILYGSQ